MMHLLNKSMEARSLYGRASRPCFIYSLCCVHLQHMSLYLQLVLPPLGLFAIQSTNKVKWIKTMFISFLGVVASFASAAYRIAVSNVLSASLGAVRFYFLKVVGWWSSQKICWSHFLSFGVYMCYCDTESSLAFCT